MVYLCVFAPILLVPSPWVGWCVVVILGWLYTRHGANPSTNMILKQLSLNLAHLYQLHWGQPCYMKVAQPDFGSWCARGESLVKKINLPWIDKRCSLSNIWAQSSPCWEFEPGENSSWLFKLAWRFGTNFLPPKTSHRMANAWAQPKYKAFGLDWMKPSDHIGWSLRFGLALNLAASIKWALAFSRHGMSGQCTLYDTCRSIAMIGS